MFATGPASAVGEPPVKPKQFRALDREHDASQGREITAPETGEVKAGFTPGIKGLPKI